jgi:preprotein translocase subunit SecD
MKRLITLLALPLVLAGCGSTTVSYKLAFNTADKSAQEELTHASMRVIERRLERMETTIKDQKITGSGSDTTLTLSLSDPKAAEQLSAEVTQPFQLLIMKQVPDGQGQVTVQGHGDFSETGIDGKDIVWGEAAEDAQRKGAVRLTFTPEGKTKLAALFKENTGKSIGIFVRGQLVSKLTVKSEEVDDNIVIRDIPNPDLARIFVDDLNVGLHVIFTPLP